MANITFEICRSFGTITANSSGWTKELNLVSWNGAAPKIDIRDWSPEHDKMGREVTLTPKETEELYTLLTTALTDASWQTE